MPPKDSLEVLVGRATMAAAFHRTRRRILSFHLLVARKVRLLLGDVKVMVVVTMAGTPIRRNLVAQDAVQRRPPGRGTGR